MAESAEAGKFSALRAGRPGAGLGRRSHELSHDRCLHRREPAGTLQHHAPQQAR